jgi:hypothetical protein
MLPNSEQPRGCEQERLIRNFLRFLRKADEMEELKLSVPTYNYTLFPTEVELGEKPEFGEPNVRVLVHQAAGIRVVLGTHNHDDEDKSDVQIERQPNGWMIFIHPLGGSEGGGYVYMHDDGRCFVVRERSFGSTPAMEVLRRGDAIPGFNSRS